MLRAAFPIGPCCVILPTYPPSLAGLVRTVLVSIIRMISKHPQNTCSPPLAVDDPLIHYAVDDKPDR